MNFRILRLRLRATLWQIERHLYAWKKPIPPNLSEELVSAHAPKKVASLAFQAVLRALKVAKGDFDSKAMLLPQNWRAVYTILDFADDVGNGGLHQFFWNSEGCLNEALDADLRLIGASEYLAVFRQAVSIYRNKKYPGNASVDKLSAESFYEGYEDRRMDELDKHFFALRPELREVLGNYIKANVGLYR